MIQLRTIPKPDNLCPVSNGPDIICTGAKMDHLNTGLVRYSDPHSLLYHLKDNIIKLIKFVICFHTLLEK
jgi:hypothetical protein